MSVKHGDKWSNYDIEFVVDQTAWIPCEDADDADEEFEFPTTLEVKEDGFNQQIPWGASGTQMEIYTKVEDMLREWQNLVFNNDCKDRKIRVIMVVTEVK